MLQLENQLERLHHEMESFGDFERCYSVELNRNMLQCDKARQVSHDAPGHDERRLEACRPQQIGTVSEKLKGSAEAAGNMTHQPPDDSDKALGPALTRSHRRISTLERQRRELLDVNREWGEEYTRTKLNYHLKIEQLRERLKACEQRAAEEKNESERKLRDFSEKMLQAKQTINGMQNRNSEMNEELLEAERQKQRLQAQYTTVARRGQQQEREIRRLNKALDERLGTSVPREDVSRTEMDALRHQAQIFKEDFLMERRDRERLKVRNAELEKNVSKLNAELQRLRSMLSCQQHCPSQKAGPVPRPTQRANDCARNGGL